MTILVTGSTGQVGGPLVDRLACRGAKVRGLVRSRDAAERLRKLGVEPVEGSFDDVESLRRALDGVERLFMLAPTGVDEAVRRQARLIDLAANAGIEQVVKLSVIGADEVTDAQIMRSHRRAEEHLEQSGLAWTHLRPCWFMQNELGQAQAIATHGSFHAPDMGNPAMIDVRDVAAAAAAVLLSDGHAGRAYVLTGPESLSYAELAERYERVLGLDVRWSEIGLDQGHEGMLASGMTDELATWITEIMAHHRKSDVSATLSPAVEELTGKLPRSFEQFVHDHANLYRMIGER
ncbi:MAG: SDR family oxidoreductase [Solirubrobacteraceae bacterium]